MSDRNAEYEGTAGANRKVSLMGEVAVAAVRAIEIGGRTLPTLGVHPNGRSFVVPMENGWNAYVIAYPRPDQTEYAVACITRHEAALVIQGEWGIGSELTDWDKRPENEWPRGDDDLLDTLERLSQWPSPPEGFGLRRPSLCIGAGAHSVSDAGEKVRSENE